MKILVTGNAGQLSQALSGITKRFPQFSFHFTNRDEIDLQVPSSISTFVAKFAPDVIINAAAWTEVDRAEDEIALAYRANAEAPGELARASKLCGSKLIHISTDYVFDGDKPDAYTENDETNPKSVYGASKLAGEQNIASEFSDYLIIRTAWVVSPFGNNFVRTMLSLAQSRETLTVVDDQFGNPTSATDLANSILSILLQWHGSSQSNEFKGLGQVYHCVGTGKTNWSLLAQQVFKISETLAGPSAQVEGIPSSSWPTKAYRPQNSSLDCGKLKKDFNIIMPNWEDSVEKIVRQLSVQK